MPRCRFCGTRTGAWEAACSNWVREKAAGSQDTPVSITTGADDYQSTEFVCDKYVSVAAEKLHLWEALPNTEVIIDLSLSD